MRTLRPDLLQGEAAPAAQAAAQAAAQPPANTGAATPGPQNLATVLIREERPHNQEDAEAVDRLLRAAFPTPAEAELLAHLRQRGDAPIALVAERLDNDHRQIVGQVVGQITFSPVTPQGQPSVRGLLALAPLAVHPQWQNRGLGAALVREGIERCKRARVAAIVVVGDPAYYQRFGFEPATPLGFTCDFATGPEFMILRLRDPLPANLTGHLRFAKAFDQL